MAGPPPRCEACRWSQAAGIKALTMSRSIDVRTLLNQHRLGAFRLRTVLLCWLIAVLDGFDVQAMAFVAPVLAKVWDISKPVMGQVLTAGLVGLMLGSVALGQVSDRVGRRPVLIGSVILFAAGSLVTAACQDIMQLLLARFVTGIGLGGVTVAALSLTAEYAPDSRRASVVTAMYVGFPIGGSLGGLAAIPLIDAYGWQSVFIAGGVAPLLLMVAVARYLPESLQYDIVSGANPERVGATLSRIAPDYAYQRGDRFVVEGRSLPRGSVAQLFAAGRASGTLLLWIICCANLLVLYLLINWLPSILVQSGSTIAKANLGAVAFNAGGVIGSLALGRLIDRREPQIVLALSYLITAIMIALLPTVQAAPLALMITVLTGAGVIGSQFCMNAVAASFYPTAIRSTGVGWALGVGRVGSVAGPLIGGMALGAGVTPQALFVLAAAPLTLCAVAVTLLLFARRRVAAPALRQVS
jgi:MFS transporter, AAHS family, 4-hydroxybenzoate transporter